MNLSRSIRSMLILCAAFQLVIARSSPAAAPTTEKYSNTRFGYRNLRVTWHGFEPKSSNALTSAISDTAWKLAPQFLGHVPISDNPNDQLIRVSANVQDDYIDYYIAVVLPNDAHPVEKEFLNEIVRVTTESANADYHRREQEYLNPIEIRVAEARDRTGEMEHRAAELRTQMRKLSGRDDISGNTISTAMTRMEEEKQKLELDTIAKTARREAIEKEVAVQGDLLSKKVSDDAIASELQKVVDARQSAMELVKQQQSQGVATPKDVNDAVALLADARAKMLERKRDAATEAGGDAVASMNRELLTLSTDLRELNARLDFVKARLPGLRDAADLLDGWNRVQTDLEKAQRDRSSAESLLRDHQLAANSFQSPTMEVTTSSDAEAPPENHPAAPQ